MYSDVDYENSLHRQVQRVVISIIKSRQTPITGGVSQKMIL